MNDARPLPRLPCRARDAHKGTAGHVLVVAGSSTYPGAAALAARGATRCGAGLVTVFTPAPARPRVAALLASEMTVPTAADATGGFTAEALPDVLGTVGTADAVVLGPGLARSDATQGFVHALLEGLAAPTVVDADGLRPFAGSPERLAEFTAPLVLTPHPGEARALLGADVGAADDERDAAARRIARASGAVVVLKGAGTVVTDGTTSRRNLTGGPVLACGGSGDVLSGAIGALLAAGMDALEAATAAVHVHGLAGDLAAREVGTRGGDPLDVLEHLPRALDAYDRRTGG